MLNNTYITREEMLEYVKGHYTSNDPLRVQWEAFSDDDQCVFLTKAYDAINLLPFTGKPKSVSQPGAFPRGDSFTSQDMISVKFAQAEQALAFSDSVTVQEIEQRERLRRAGVKQYTIGDLSETFVDGATLGSFSDCFGLCKAAYKHLSKWLRGGYKICTSIKKHCGHM